MRTFRLLSLRRLRQQPLRAAVAIVAVAAGVALAVAIVVTRASVDTSVADFGRSLAGPAPLRIVGPTPRGGVRQETVDAAAAVDGVAAAVPVIQAPSYVDTRGASGSTTDNVLVLGVDCRVEALLGPFRCDPALLAGLGDQVLAIGPGLAPPEGATASLRTDVGRRDLAGAAVMDQLAGINGGRVAVLSLPAAERAFLQGGRVDVVYVLPEDGADLATVRAHLESLGPQLTVLGAEDPPAETQLVLVTFLPLFTLLGLFGLGTGAVLVRNTVALSLEERRRQLAITGALGADRRTLIGGPLLEAAVLGGFGGLLGAVGGIAVAGPIVTGVSSFTEAVAGVPIVRHVPPSTLAAGLVLGAAVGGLAAIGPARRAARLDVAADLSGRAAATEGAPIRLVRRLVVGLVVTGVGVAGCWVSQRAGAIEQWQASVGLPAFLLVSVTTMLVGGALAPLQISWVGRRFQRRRAPWVLAIAELARDPRRTGVLAVAVASPIIIGFATDGFVASAREGITRDFDRSDPGVSVSTVEVNTGNDAFLSPDAQDALAALPGVASLDVGTFVSAGRGIGTLLGVQTFSGGLGEDWTVLRGALDPVRFAAGEVLIGPGLARRTGARPGDTVEVPGIDGPEQLTVMAIVMDGDFGGSGITVDRATFERLFGPRPPAYARLTPEPGVSEAELAATVRAAAPSIDESLYVLTTDELVADIVASIDDQMLPFRAMQQELLVVAFVAVLSTLLLSGLQRRREHGLLAAVGADPATLRKVVLAETGVVVVAATVNAVVIAPVVLWSMLQVIPILIGNRNPFAVDWASLPVGLAVTGTAALVAASWPAWRAGRVEVLDALRYE